VSPHHRTSPLLEQAEQHAAARLDRVFTAGFLVQWLAGIGFVWLRSPVADDLFTAIVIGASIATVPTTLIVWKPGSAPTRHAIAVAQMLYGTLIVYLTAGKLGTPYHVFVSLTFLALYRDWRVVATAVGVVLFDIVGVGVLSGEVAPARWVQHLAWVMLAAACVGIAARRAALDLMLARPPVANDTRESTKSIAHIDALGSSPTLLAIHTIHTGGEPSVFSDLEGEEGMHELLESFVQRLRETSSELEATTDHSELLRISQRVRGAAGSYGFAAISAAAGSVEEAIHAHRDVATKVAHLAGLCRRARSRQLVARAA